MSADPDAPEAAPPPLLDALKFDEHGLIPAIMQDHRTRDVLMFAWMNRQSVSLTLSTAKAHFYSRSRRTLWLKGGTSGHVQHVKWVRTDCDRDVLLVGVDQTGTACHEGYRSCFFTEARRADSGELTWHVADERVIDPATVYRQ